MDDEGATVPKRGRKARVPEGFTQQGLAEYIAANPHVARLKKGKLKAELQRSKVYVPAKEIDQHYAASDFHQIRKQRNSQRRPPLLITAAPRSFQVDIAYTGKGKDPASGQQGQNLPQKGGVRYFLLLVDVLSRKAYAYPMKNRSMDTIIGAYTTFLTEAGAAGPINSVTGDDEFSAKAFADLNKRENIQLYTHVAQNDHISKGHDKLGIVDRCMRTLKQGIFDSNEAAGDTRWAARLPDVVADYNKTTLPIGLQSRAPDKVYAAPEVALVEKHTKEQEINAARLANHQPPEAGDKVRYQLPKGPFDKEAPPFSRTVHEVESRVGASFKLVGLSRMFHENDLQVVPEGAADVPLPAKIVSSHNYAVINSIMCGFQLT